MAKIRVGIVYGGRSVEHEVSIASATSILQALDPSRYEIQLIAISKEGRWLEMAGRVDDNLLERIAVVGGRAEAAAKIRARCAGLVDRVSLIAPFSPDPDLWADVVRGIKADL